MNRSYRIFVAQVVDEKNNNAQVLNARSLLKRFRSPDIEWIAPYYNAPDPDLLAAPNVKLVRLYRKHLWYWHKIMLYQMRIDAIFYPGAKWFDDLALQLRKKTGRLIPVIATLEGFVGNKERQEKLSQWAGHQVFCQYVTDKALFRNDRVLKGGDHIIAISPFIAKVGQKLYGDKFSVLPLGIDGGIFYSRHRNTRERFAVIGAGRLYENKQPGLFIELAAAFPQADFFWYGWGEMREELLREKEKRGLKNVFYPGPILPEKLADEFRSAHLLVLPSKSEGVPKVTQEAAACGLPVIIFGYYEAPTVIDGKNGYMVWDDEQLFNRVGELISDPSKAKSMGQTGAQMALEWDWDLIAPRWEDVVINTST